VRSETKANQPRKTVLRKNLEVATLEAWCNPKNFAIIPAIFRLYNMVLMLQAVTKACQRYVLFLLGAVFQG